MLKFFKNPAILELWFEITSCQQTKRNEEQNALWSDYYLVYVLDER